MRPFTATEMQRRSEEITRRMGAANLDAVLATSYPGIYYLAQAPIFQFGRPAALVVPRTTAPVLVTSVLERSHLEEQSSVADRRYYTDHSIDGSYAEPTTPWESVLTLLGGALDEANLLEGRIGYEDGTLPVRDLRALETAFPAVEFVPFGDAMDEQRLVLSGEELRIVRLACRVADAGLLAFIEHAQPGAYARDLVRLCRRAMEDAAQELAPDMPFLIHPNIGVRDPGKHVVHSYWESWGPDDVLREGVVLDTIFDCLLWGYWGAVERSIAVGKPEGSVLTAYEAMVRAHRVTIDAIRPGRTFAEVDSITKDEIARAGYRPTDFGSGMGRGITSYENGARVTPLDLRLYNHRVIEEGMAISVEPMLGDFEAPFRHCSTVIVTAEGTELCSVVPADVIWV